MSRARYAKTLGVVLPVLLPAYAGAQRSGEPIRMSSSPSVAPRPSSLPVIRMGSLPRIERNVPSWDGSLRRGLARSKTFGLWRTGVMDAPYLAQSVVPYQVPVYVPVPVPIYPRYVRVPAAPAKPYDPTKSKMLTIGGGADGGAGVMRIEQVNDSVLRLTWLGSSRPIREARLFLADSAQRPLRTSLVDAATPSALFQIAGLEPKIAYTGLTIIFADGATQTTLVPYR